MKIIDLLKTLGFPVIRQGSLPEGEQYPDSFFTYWNFDTTEERHLDNQATRIVLGYWVYFYSTDIDLTYSELERARKLLKANGFICDERGQDVASDTPSHTGRMITVYLIENE